MDDDFVAQPLAVGGKCKRNMVVKQCSVKKSELKNKKRGVKVIGVVENTKDKNDTNAVRSNGKKYDIVKKRRGGSQSSLRLRSAKKFGSSQHKRSRKTSKNQNQNWNGDDKNQNWNDTEDGNKNVKSVLQPVLVLYTPESSDDEKCENEEQTPEDCVNGNEELNERNIEDSMQVINLSTDVKRRLKFVGGKKTPRAAQRSPHVRKPIAPSKDKVINIESTDSLPKKKVKPAKSDTQLSPLLQRRSSARLAKRDISSDFGSDPITGSKSAKRSSGKKRKERALNCSRLVTATTSNKLGNLTRKIGRDSEKDLKKDIKFVMLISDEDSDFEKHRPCKLPRKTVTQAKKRIVHEKQLQKKKRKALTQVDEEGKMKKKVETEDHNNQKPKKILVRASPHIFSEIVSQMSETQKKWVSSAGFGPLLSFVLKKIPQTIATNSVWWFDYDNSILNLWDEDTLRVIHVDENDVRDILGLPQGKRDIILVDNNAIQEAWRLQFPKKRAGHKVTEKMVSLVMKSSRDADVRFKQNFMVLMMNLFVRCIKNSYVSQEILGFVGNYDDASEYNWCKLVFDSLKQASEKWLKDPHTQFYCGSLMFLMYFYLDRVKNPKLQVQSTCPAFIGWMNSDVAARDILENIDNSFGKGEIQVSYEIVKCAKPGDDTKNSDETTKNSDEATNNSDEATNNSDEHSFEIAEEGLLRNVKLTEVEDLQSDDINQPAEQKVAHNEDVHFDELNHPKKEQTTPTSEDISCGELNKSMKDQVAPNKDIHSSELSHPNKEQVAPTEDICSFDLNQPTDVRQDFENNDQFKTPEQGFQPVQSCSTKVQNANIVSKNISVSRDLVRDMDNIDYDEFLLIEKDLISQVENGIKDFKDIQKRCISSFKVAKALVFLPNQRLNELEDEFSKLHDVTKTSITAVEERTNLELAKVLFLTNQRLNVLEEDLAKLQELRKSSTNTKEKVEERSTLDWNARTPEDWKDIDVMSKPQSFRQTNKMVDPVTSLGKVKLEERNTEEDINNVSNQDELLQLSFEKILQERPRREHRIGEFQKSPYISRPIDIDKPRLTKAEEDVWNWLNRNNKDMMQEIFNWQGVRCLKHELKSLQFNTELLVGVVDTYSCILNYEEQYRSTVSPKRFFCTTYTTVGTLRKNNEVASDVKYLRFESKLDFVLEKYEADIKNIDMMFFPIHHVNHYYVVCFNIKNTSIDLLDNYKHGDCLNTVYEGYPESLKIMIDNQRMYIPEVRRGIAPVEDVGFFRI
ncbi:hypothetical protein POM88_050943 [Heracleum sosnowskyi]|uniref:Ubiquitin-like protease family profile domain-containing protein n=1 Tax=Heracleum sosnowskyi TaxID=360622 RepID=A0AAD8H0Z9_9APIA|nr:hypothetical protein POM88_050943 [Heracleum sosnowskyi]